MFTVALIGADGAGKTTVARRLESELELPVTYIYMGVSAEASNHQLPSTRIAHAVKRRTEASRAARPRGVRRACRAARSALRLANRLAEEWYRQLLAWSCLRKGSIVVFDRHFFSDYYAYDVAGAGRAQMSRRIHGLLLDKVYPKPDLVIYLDAPPEVLLARKGEGTAELLERRRDDYLAIGRLVPHFAVVDASKPLDAVTDDVVAEITSFARSRGTGTPVRG